MEGGKKIQETRHFHCKYTLRKGEGREEVNGRKKGRKEGGKERGRQKGKEGLQILVTLQ